MRSWSPDHQAGVWCEKQLQTRERPNQEGATCHKMESDLVLWAAGSLQLGEIKRGFLQDRREKDTVKKERVGRPRRAGAPMSLGSRERLRSGLELA